MQPSNEINIYGIIQTFKYWKKYLIGFVAICLLASAVYLFLSPKKYLASAVCFPSNPVLADKSFIFNENVQGLYATYGGGTELDRLVSTAQLDTLFRFAVQRFDLKKVYKIKDTGAIGLKKTIKTFKSHYNVEKTALGELKIHVWDEDAAKSAQMANALLNHIAMLATAQFNEFNKKIADALDAQIKEERKSYISLSDSLQNGRLKPSVSELIRAKKEGILQNISTSEKLLKEFTLTVNASAPALQIQEYAVAQAKPDKPKKLRILSIAFVLSSLFGILLVFVLESRKKFNASKT